MQDTMKRQQEEALREMTAVRGEAQAARLRLEEVETEARKLRLQLVRVAPCLCSLSSCLLATPSLLKRPTHVPGAA